MKKHLKVIAHILVLIIIYILSFILPGAIQGLLDFPQQIDFLRIIIVSLLAIAIFIFGSKIYVEKVMQFQISSLRIKFKKPETLWVIAAISVPAIVVLIYYLTEKAVLIQNSSDSYHTIRFFTHIIFVGGLCAGIIEEIFFRGILLGFLEKKYGIIYGIIISSLLFGVAHLLNVDKFSIALIIQVTLFISIYGVIMSFIVYITNNIWNAISIHISWNIITSLIIKNGEDIESNFALQMSEKNLLWNGGEYGIDLSIAAFTAFIIIGLIALLWRRIKFNNSSHQDYRLFI